MQDYTKFLDTFFEEINKAGIDISGLTLDHIAHQASSSEDYDKVREEFSKLGAMVSEEVVGGRRVCVFDLHSPLKYKDYTIQALELVEPKPDQVFESAFQHAELIYEGSFEGLIQKYPNIDWDKTSMNRDEFAHLKLNFDNGLTLKFLHAPILEQFASKNI